MENKFLFFLILTFGSCSAYIPKRCGRSDCYGNDAYISPKDRHGAIIGGKLELNCTLDIIFELRPNFTWQTPNNNAAIHENRFSKLYYKVNNDTVNEWYNHTEGLVVYDFDPSKDLGNYTCSVALNRHNFSMETMHVINELWSDVKIYVEPLKMPVKPEENVKLVFSVDAIANISLAFFRCSDPSTCPSDSIPLTFIQQSEPNRTQSFTFKPAGDGYVKITAYDHVGSSSVKVDIIVIDDGRFLSVWSENLRPIGNGRFEDWYHCSGSWFKYGKRLEWDDNAIVINETECFIEPNKYHKAITVETALSFGNNKYVCRGIESSGSRQEAIWWVNKTNVQPVPISFEFNCVTDVEEATKIAWFKNNIEIDVDSPKPGMLFLANNRILYIPINEKKFEGNYTCITKNLWGERHIRKENIVSRQKTESCPTAGITKNIHRKPIHDYKVVCHLNGYLTDRLMRSDSNIQVFNNIDESQCTHIVYDTSLAQTDGIDRQLDNIRKQGVSILISLEDNPQYRLLAVSNNDRPEFVPQMTEFIETNRFGGLQLSLRKPDCFDNDQPIGKKVCENEKRNLVSLVRAFSEAFKRRGLLLSLLISESEDIAEALYDLPELSTYVDFFEIANFERAEKFEETIESYIERGMANRQIVMQLQAIIFSPKSVKSSELAKFFDSRSDGSADGNTYTENDLISSVDDFARRTEYIRANQLGGAWFEPNIGFSEESKCIRHALLRAINKILRKITDPNTNTPECSFYRDYFGKLLH